MKEKLRVGILLNDYFIPSWEYQILLETVNTDFAQLVLVIKDNRVSSVPESGNSLAWNLIKLLEKTDRAIFRNRPDYNLKKDASGLLRDVYEVETHSADTEEGDDKALSAIKNSHPDIILDIGYHNMSDSVLSIPKFGVWRFSTVSSKRRKSADRGFWEVIERIPVTRNVLGILTPGNKKNNVIFESWESTCHYSINVNRNSISWRSALFVPRIMKGLYNRGEEYLAALNNRYSVESPEIDNSFSPVSFKKAAGSLLKYCTVVTESIFKKIFFTDAFSWEVLYNISSDKELYSDAFGSFRKLKSPGEVFWADPFVIAENGQYYIFVEEFIYKNNRAHLSVLTLDQTGTLLNSGRIIERPYHMSYPFIFKVDGTYYMIPETSKNRTIDRYKCIEFPGKWEFDRNIMENISAVDTTLFQFNNRWWLFTSIDQTSNISGCSTELFLFFTDDVLNGEWESHPLNPIVSDIRNARSAGKIFIQDGKICRPSQNCSGRYGIGFNINHITKLTESEYEEHLLVEVKPDWNKKLRGTHTLNFDKDFTVIDAYSFRKRFFNI